MTKKYDPRKDGADCDACPFKKQTPVPPETTKNPKYIVVGEAPGAHEVEQGKPFVGRSGQFFEKTLKRLHVVRSDLHISNALLCPIRSKDYAEYDKDIKQALKCCTPRLDRELAAHPRTPIIPMGSIALKGVLKKNHLITDSRGFVWQRDEHQVYPTLHPAYVLRDDAQFGAFFSDLKRAVRRTTNNITTTEKPEYVVPRTRAELELALERLHGDYIGLDVETSREPATVNTLLCIGLSDGKQTVVVSWTQRGAPPMFRKLLAEFIAARTIVTHNGPAFDQIVMRRHSMPIRNWEDTLIAHHTFASHMPQRLGHVVGMYRDVEPWKIVFGKKGDDEKGEAKDTEDEENLHYYNAFDVHLTINAWFDMQKDLAPFTKVYEIDKRTAELCQKMQLNGVRIDIARKQDLSRQLVAKEKRLVIEMSAVAGKPVEPTKDRLTADILFNDFGVTPFKWTPKGAVSVDKSVLQAVALRTGTDEAKFAKALLNWRLASKMRGSYVDNLPIEGDERVHASWRSFGAVTGRLSARKPPLQIMKRPSKDPKEKNEPEYQLRSQYIASPGRTIVCFDYSQVEMRVAAYISGDKAFIASCETSDLHVANARVIFGDMPCLMDLKEAKEGEGKKYRDVAKNAGFAICYYAKAETVYEYLRAQGFSIQLVDVKKMLLRFRRLYARYYEYVESNIAFVHKHCYLDLPLSGRRRYFTSHPKPTEVANSAVQSCAAYIMNRAMDKIDLRIRKEDLLIAQVHDAGYYDILDDRVEIVKKIIREEATAPLRILDRDVSFPIDLKTGKRWSDAA